MIKSNLIMFEIVFSKNRCLEILWPNNFLQLQDAIE